MMELENRKLAIQEALAESDTLQIVYKKVLELNPETQNGSQTSITIEGNDEKNTTKEFDLYKSDIELRRELVTIERETQNKEFIVEILSNTPSRGFIDSSIKVLNKAFSPTIFFATLFFFILFSILLLLRFIKFLEKFKSKV